ncbi:MAG TPA: hypothetical protein PLE60_08150 [Candidatus Latescibacteria bacterium]|nr:MAG: Lipid-A-disaccharide synthase [Candidatus Latescibacteria bacterium ADurb.Bin168]HPU85294.1 hypothetical protein [Candidatus Latescibacterota bacterium]
MNFWISALEPSGDRWGAALVRAIASLAPNARVEGISGPLMRDAGADGTRAPDGAMGFAEPLARFPEYCSLMARSVRQYRSRQPDVSIVIDAPDFHIPFLRLVRDSGVPTVYFSPPQVWAWRRSRARAIAHLCARVVTLFDWERAYFAPPMETGRVVWEGHPLVDELPEPREQRRGGDLLVLLPGSRKSEIDRLSAVFADVGRRLGAPCVFRAPTDRHAGWIHAALLRAGRAPLPITTSPLAQLWMEARACVACAGTATLEAALAGIPMVIAYRTDWLTYSVARRLVHTRWIGLPNILLRSDAYPECIQVDAEPSRIASALATAVERPPGFWTEKAREIRTKMGQPGVAKRVINLAIEMANTVPHHGIPQ